MLALWTKRLGQFTIILAAVSVLGLGVSICALRETQKAYDPIKISADAAKKSVDISIQSQRAFVYPKDPRGPFVFITINGKENWVFIPTWQSIGSTHPNNLFVETHCLFDINADQMIDPNTYFEKHTITRKMSRAIGPNQETQSATCMFHTDQMHQVYIGKAVFYVLMRARYDDVFGNAHITEHCDRFTVLTGDPFTTKEKIFPAGEPCSTHNCIDKQCEQQQR
jgi:hypothetical protein